MSTSKPVVNKTPFTFQGVLFEPRFTGAWWHDLQNGGACVVGIDTDGGWFAFASCPPFLTLYADQSQLKRWPSREEALEALFEHLRIGCNAVLELIAPTLVRQGLRVVSPQ